MVEVCVPYEAEEQQGREKGSIDSYWFKQTGYTINMPNGKKNAWEYSSKYWPSVRRYGMFLFKELSHERFILTKSKI